MEHKLAEHWVAAHRAGQCMHRLPEWAMSLHAELDAHVSDTCGSIAKQHAYWNLRFDVADVVGSCHMWHAVVAICCDISAG